MTRDWSAAPAALDAVLDRWPGLRIRLDFNACLTAREFLAFAGTLTPRVRAAIDFVEDPFVFDAAGWHDARCASGLPLAADRWCDEPAADAFPGIVKPAAQDADAILERAMRSGRRLVVTSNMDHPVGVAWAAWHAARFARAGVLDGPCGLCTAGLFQPDAFSRRLVPGRGGFLPVPVGPGLGFGDLLEDLAWENLA